MSAEAAPEEGLVVPGVPDAPVSVGCGVAGPEPLCLHGRGVPG